MKSIIHFLLIFCCINLQAQRQELKLASDVWPPFTNVETKKSIATDLVQIALERIGVSSKNNITNFENVILGIDNSIYNGSTALWKNPNREKTLLFSEPYLQNQLVLVCLKGGNIDIESVSELTDKKIGVIEGYSYDEDLLKATHLELVFSENDQMNLKKLVLKKIDYLLVDDLLIQYLLKYQLNEVHKYLTISDKPFQIKTLHFALHKNTPNAEEIISKFNEEIKSMLKDGTYNKIIGLNWIEADINNDGITELVLKGNSAGLEAPEETYSVFYDSNQSKGFYIDEVYYNSWDKVPEKYKNTNFTPSSIDNNNTGFNLKF